MKLHINQIENNVRAFWAHLADTFSFHWPCLLLLLFLPTSLNLWTRPDLLHQAKVRVMRRSSSGLQAMKSKTCDVFTRCWKAKTPSCFFTRSVGRLKWDTDDQIINTEVSLEVHLPLKIISSDFFFFFTSICIYIYCFLALKHWRWQLE